MSILCRVGVHRWHHYYPFAALERRRCTRAGCHRDMVAP